ncbi:NifB/NifX family molybdenum-iron cluster-binding protein, partial [Frankia sp. CpI1-P]
QTRDVDRYCNGPSDCDEDASKLDRTIEMLSDCAAVLCSKIGLGPREALEEAGIEPVEIYDLIDKAVAEIGARLVTDRAPAEVGTP